MKIALAFSGQPRYILHSELIDITPFSDFRNITLYINEHATEQKYFYPDIYKKYSFLNNYSIEDVTNHPNFDISLIRSSTDTTGQF